MDSLPLKTNQFSDTQEPAASQSQRQAVPVNYEYSLNLPELLNQLDLSVLISTQWRCGN